MIALISTLEYQRDIRRSVRVMVDCQDSLTSRTSVSCETLNHVLSERVKPIQCHAQGAI